MLTLSQTAQGIRANGGPNTNFTGCNVMSNSSAQCNGSNLQATFGLAHGTNNGCGISQPPPVPIVADPFSALLTSNPIVNPCSSYPQETRQGSTWSGGIPLAGTLSLTNTPHVLCGDVRLTGDVTINAPAGAVVVIENGQLDLNGHTLSTASGSGATIVFTGTNGSYMHVPTDHSSGGSGVLDIQAPTSGPWSGVAMYQDPALTTGVDITYTGNSPAWDISGLVYMPNANVTISGAVNKSSNGAACMVMVANTVLINGTGSFYNQSPAGCTQAGLNMPSATIPGRAQLVY